MPGAIPAALIPLPKRIAVGDKTRVPPADLVVVAPRHRSGASQAAVELVRRRVRHLLGKRPRFQAHQKRITRPVRIALGTPASNRLVRRAEQQGHITLAGEQLGPEAYQITYHQDPDKKTLTFFLVGNTDPGVYYAAQTFVHALTARDGSLSIPLLEVTDWPDFEQRGFLRCETETLDASWWEQTLDTAAGWKLNLAVVHLPADVLGAALESDVRASRRAKRTLTRLTQLADERAMAMVPCVSDLSAAFADALGRTRPGGVVTPGATGAPGEPRRADLAQVGVRDDVVEALIQLVDRLQLRQLGIGLSEHGYGRTVEPNRVQFQNEATVIGCVYEGLQKRSPPCDLHVMLSPGSRPYTREVLDALPKSIKFVDCGGQIAYRIGTGQAVRPAVAEMAQRGYWLTLTPAWGRLAWGGLLVPAAGTIRARLHEAETADLKGVVAEASFLDQYLYNLAAGAEWLWNLDGRSPRELYQAHAAAQGLGSAEAGADYLEQMEHAAQTILRANEPTCGSVHLSDRSLVASALARAQRLGLGEGDQDGVDEWFLGELPDRLLGPLEQATQACQSAMKLARRLRSKRLLYEAESLKLVAQVYHAAFWVLYVIGRECLPDRGERPWTSWEAEVRRSLRGLKRYLIALPKSRRRASAGNTAFDDDLKRLRSTVDQFHELMEAGLISV